ncbi:MAG: NosD domain-containing protein, partial [bacterium]|nr:NosD domain-containing protein [bacterium]
GPTAGCTSARCIVVSGQDDCSTGIERFVRRAFTSTYGTVALFDFSLSNGGDKSVTQGLSTVNPVTATLVSGTSVRVSFTAVSVPPLIGGIMTFGPPFCTPTCVSTLTLTTAASTPLGTYTITVTGTGGSVVKTTTFQLSVSLAVATTYTVSPSGDDSNPCTPGVTFLTIQRAADCAQPGEKIFVQAGTYYERVVMPRSGSSGNPIIIEGARGGAGEYLAIVDGTTLVAPSSWVPATAGDGFSGNGSSYPTVWKMPNPGYIAWGLSVNGKNTMRIPNRYMDGELPISSIQPQLNGKDKLKQLAGAVCTHGGNPANCWDGKEVLWGNAGGLIFIRFRDGDNPNLKTIGLSPGRISKSSVPFQGAAFKIQSQDYITLKDMHIRGGDIAVLIRNASNNIIENNWITRGHSRVFVYGGGSQNNIIRTNTMNSDMYGYGLANPSYVPNTNTGYSGIVSRHMYYEDKFYPGESTEDDTGVWFSGNPVNTQVQGNLIEYGSGQGIKMANGSINTKVSGNTIKHNAAQGIFIIGSNDGMQLYDNLIHENSYNIRWNESGSSGTAYIYRNRVWNPSGGNNNFYFGMFSPATAFGTTLYFYHNSIAGQKAMLLAGVAASGDVWLNSYWVNNIFSSEVSGETAPETVSSINDIGCFDRNWVQGPNFYNENPPPWYGANNVDGAAELWSDVTLPSFLLPPGSPAEEIGYDISQPWNCRGSRPALPGFSPGYFSGTRPDAGAIQ